MGRILGVSNVSVLNWIHSFGKAVGELSSESQEIEMVEVDEMHFCYRFKKTTVGYGLLPVDMGKDASTSLLAIEATKQPKTFGRE
ncbi:hypothetical protein EZS27_016396 [termite gut metagenome]|uniref:Uncharacterized protein n=1 Tax=termite gut metagenome TaxID=433724 RepID=A0A5J4RNS7_9ZZZZ